MLEHSDGSHNSKHNQEARQIGLYHQPASLSKKESEVYYMSINIDWNTDGHETICSNRKEANYVGQYTLLDRATCAVYGELRFYATASRSYACFWLNGREKGCICGGSFAGGYGYHRKSAAAERAFRVAGVTLEPSISGVGDAAIREALEAIGCACGIDPVVIEAHA